MKLFSKFAKLYGPESVKKKPFAVFIDDEDGFAIKAIKKELKKYPKLKEISKRYGSSKSLLNLKEGDIILFGDALGPFDYDYRVIELQDLRSTNGLETFELTLEFKDVKETIKTYHKMNYPEAHRSLRIKNRSRRFSPPQYAYYSRITGKKVDVEKEYEFEIPRSLLKKYGEIEIAIEIPKKKNERWSKLDERDLLIGRKKKVKKEKYVVHQNFVKVGLRGYNIYTDKRGDEYVNVKGTTYGVVRRAGKLSFLIEL